MSDQSNQGSGNASGSGWQAPTSTPPPEVPSSVTEKPPVRGGAVTFGVLLIVLGVAVTAGRWIPGLNLVNAWPLIVMVLGAARVLRSRDAYGVLDGLTTVLIGGILLMNTTGRLAWGVWVSIASLWPLLLVAAGIAIVGKAVTQSWLRVVAQLVIIGGLLFGALVMPAGSWRFPLVVGSLGTGGPSVAFSESIRPDPAVRRGTATVQWGAAEIGVTSGSGIASATGQAPASWKPRLTGDVSGDSVDVLAGFAGEGSPGSSGDRLDLELGRDVRWERIAVKVGAASSRIDLSDLDVARVELDTGASDSSITLGERASDVTVRVQAGVANVVVRVPKSAAVTVASQGPSAVSVPAGFTRTKGELFDEAWEYRPPGASTKIDLAVSGGIMNVRVETY
ncbi:MAG TPA: hypothetical protein VF902_04405 [Coriobacteriia bacterium]